MALITVKMLKLFETKATNSDFYIKQKKLLALQLEFLWRGTERIRTAVAAFAELSLTTRPRYHFCPKVGKGNNVSVFCKKEKRFFMILQPSSENDLLLNANGRIRNLDICSNQLASTILLTSNYIIAQAIISALENIEIDHVHNLYHTVTGFLDSSPISLICHPAGSYHMDIVMNELDAVQNINFDTRQINETVRSLQIIKLDSALSLQPDIAPFQWMLESFSIGLDNLIEFYRYEPNAAEAFLLHSFQQHCSTASLQPYIAESSVRLRNHFMNICIQGIGVSCGGMYAPQGRKLRLRSPYKYLIDTMPAFSSGIHRIITISSDTAAFYCLGKMMGHHCISLNAALPHYDDVSTHDDTSLIQALLEGDLLSIVASL
jgi:uridine phosphorylase